MAFGWRTTPLGALLRGGRRRIVRSSRTRLGPPEGAGVVARSRNLRVGLAIVALVAAVLSWLAARGERRARRQQAALEAAEVSTIRESQRVLRGQISDALTGSQSEQQPPMAVPAEPPTAAAPAAPSAPPAAQVDEVTAAKQRAQQQAGGASAPAAASAPPAQAPWAAEPPPPPAASAEPPPMFNPAWSGGVVDRVFVHLEGWIWTPDQHLVRAPFTSEAVISFSSRVTHEYEVLVRFKHRRKVKSGRRKGARGKDDPGSDSEYEEEERTRWERRSREVWSREGAAGALYVEDSTGRVRFEPTQGERGWAAGFEEQIFRDFESTLPHSWREALGGVLRDLVSSERSIGYRRTESVVRRGMAFEGAGEMAIVGGSLTLREPSASPGLRSLATTSSGTAPELSGMPLVAELRRSSTASEPLAKKKGTVGRRWAVGKWVLRTAAAGAAVVAAVAGA